MTVPDKQTSWWQRLKEGLSKSAGQITENISAVFTKRKLDAAALEELEEILIKADLGPAVAARLVEDFSKERFGKDVDEREVRTALSEQIEKILTPVARDLDVDAGKKPFVVLMVGVNGAGKTTTLGKMAKMLTDDGKKVMLVAGIHSALRRWGSLRCGVSGRERKSSRVRRVRTRRRWHIKD